MDPEDIEAEGLPEQQQAEQQQTPETPEAEPPRVIDGIEIPADLSTVQDPDLLEFYQIKIAAAEEEAAAKEAAAKEEKPADGSGTPPEGATEPEKPATTAPKPDAPMIPKARLDEVLASRDRAAQEAAYWRGRAEAAAAVGKPAEQQQAPAQTPEQRLAEVHAQQDALAEKFDAGEMSMKDFKAQERALMAAERAIHDEQMLARIPKPPAPQAPQQQAEDLYLAEQSAKIEAEHPYSALVFPMQAPADKAESAILAQRQQMLKTEAAAAVLAKNPGLRNGPQADLLFRKELAELTDRYGPIWFPGQKPAAPQAPATQPGMSTRAQDRLAKLATAAQQPADINTVGTQGTGAGQITDADIAKMSDDEIADLPDATRARLLGIP